MYTVHTKPVSVWLLLRKYDNEHKCVNIFISFTGTQHVPLDQLLSLLTSYFVRSSHRKTRNLFFRLFPPGRLRCIFPLRSSLNSFISSCPLGSKSPPPFYCRLHSFFLFTFLFVSSIFFLLHQTFIFLFP
jgi:hypothetical protein